MVQARFGKVVGIAVFREVRVHERDALRLVVIRPDVHHLYAQPLFDRYELDIREACLLLLFRFRDSPLEILPRHEVRDADNQWKSCLFL